MSQSDSHQNRLPPVLAALLLLPCAPKFNWRDVAGDHLRGPAQDRAQQHSVYSTSAKGWPPSPAWAPHIEISTRPTATGTYPVPPGTRRREGTGGGSQQEPTADPTGPPRQRGTGPGRTPRSPSWCEIRPSRQVLGLEGVGRQPPKPVLEQERLLHCLCHVCPNDHRSPALPNTLPGSYKTTVLPTRWPDSHKNRLQLTDKQLERLPRPESRSTRNISAVDTHKHRVFALAK